MGASDRTDAGVRGRHGATFHQWRTRVRILAALRGWPAVSVAAVAPTVGYATASAFGAAFRRILGTSPSAYLGDALTMTAHYYSAPPWHTRRRHAACT